MSEKNDLKQITGVGSGHPGRAGPAQWEAPHPFLCPRNVCSGRLSHSESPLQGCSLVETIWKGYATEPY